MKFSFITAGNEDTASSRIRAYSLHRELVRSGIDSTIGYNPEANVLVVQKRVNAQVLKQLIAAKEQGQFIVYDVDDLGPALAFWIHPVYFRLVIRIADLVTTDTRGHLEYLKSRFDIPNLAIIPDAIDYYPSGVECGGSPAESPLRILWFGSLGNIAMFEKYAEIITALPDTQVVVASTGYEVYSSKYPAISFVTWTREGMKDILQSCHLSCLMHDGSDIGMSKSNNKMITSIAWGVPAIVSNTPEYARTAKEAGIDFAVFNTAEELVEILQTLRCPEKRKSYLDTAQKIIWNNYSPGVLKEHFIMTIAQYADKKRITKVSLSLLLKLLKVVC